MDIVTYEMSIYEMFQLHPDAVDLDTLKFGKHKFITAFSHLTQPK